MGEDKQYKKEAEGTDDQIDITEDVEDEDGDDGGVDVEGDEPDTPASSDTEK